MFLKTNKIKAEVKPSKCCSIRNLKTGCLPPGGAKLFSLSDLDFGTQGALHHWKKPPSKLKMFSVTLQFFERTSL